MLASWVDWSSDNLRTTATGTARARCRCWNVSIRSSRAFAFSVTPPRLSPIDPLRVRGFRGRREPARATWRYPHPWGTNRVGPMWTVGPSARDSLRPVRVDGVVARAARRRRNRRVRRGRAGGARGPGRGNRGLRRGAGDQGGRRPDVSHLTQLEPWLIGFCSGSGGPRSRRRSGPWVTRVS